MYTFRRPMFRGGKIDSRGTGITSGLSYNKGGRVGLRFGGSPFGAPIPPGSALSQPTGIGAAQIYQRPIGPPRGGLGMGTGKFRFPMLSSQVRAAMGFGNPLSILGFNLPTAAVTAIPGSIAGLMYLNRPETLAASKVMRDEPASTFDETAMIGIGDEPGEMDDYLERLRTANTQGEKISFKDALFLDPETMTYPTAFGRIEDVAKRAAIEKAKTGKQTENPLDDGEGTALSPKDIKILELQKLVEKFTKAEPKAKDTNMEESIEIDKEKFAKALGRDKARGQDISDMLLSFSSKALAPDATVKSAFAEFAADEVKRPSRMRKIDDSAAALAINKYIKGEISKAEAENLIKRLELQSKLTSERSQLTPGQAYARSKSTGFANRVKDAALEVLGEDSPAPKFEVVKSKDMIPVEEGGKFKFSAEDVGVIYIEEDTRQSYTFDSDGNKIPFINA